MWRPPKQRRLFVSVQLRIIPATPQDARENSGANAYLIKAANARDFNSQFAPASL
jgi:hypothetical protein